MSYMLLSLLVITLIGAVPSTNSYSIGDNAAIVNLTSAINELIMQSSGLCPLAKSRDSLTDLMQLVFTKQLLSTINDGERCMSKIEDLKQIIKKMNKKIDSLTQAMNNQSAGTIQPTEDDDIQTSDLYHSCDELLAKQPSSPSGYYLLADSHGRVRHVYCHMENLCNSGGGWMRVAHLNMTNSSEKCPEQFSTYSSGGVRGCGRPSSSGGSCAGITFSLRDFEYTKVCGKVIGYQFGFPDGFVGSNIESIYVDGVSITHGSNPRKHIWTLAAGTIDDRYSEFNYCPCGSTPTTPPSFVGSDYYCEAGCQDLLSLAKDRLYSSDRLWDGQECGNHETACCQRTLIPWFLKSFAYSTTDYIEMRICNSEDTHDENAPVEQYEIYIK